MSPSQQNIEIALSLLENEISGDVGQALGKLAPDYSMTWVYRSPLKGTLFPSSKRGEARQFNNAMEEAYRISGRSYDVKNIASADKIVMLELVESYPDPKTGMLFRTPMVIVLEFEGEKVRRGRHYCDPNLSHLYLGKSVIDDIFAL